MASSSNCVLMWKRRQGKRHLEGRGVHPAISSKSWGHPPLSESACLLAAVPMYPVRLPEPAPSCFFRVFRLTVLKGTIIRELSLSFICLSRRRRGCTIYLNVAEECIGKCGSIWIEVKKEKKNASMLLQHKVIRKPPSISSGPEFPVSISRLLQIIKNAAHFMYSGMVVGGLWG